MTGCRCLDGLWLYSCPEKLRSCRKKLRFLWSHFWELHSCRRCCPVFRLWCFLLQTNSCRCCSRCRWCLLFPGCKPIPTCRSRLSYPSGCWCRAFSRSPFFPWRCGIPWRSDRCNKCYCCKHWCCLLSLYSCRWCCSCSCCRSACACCAHTCSGWAGTSSSSSAS